MQTHLPRVQHFTDEQVLVTYDDRLLLPGNAGQDAWTRAMDSCGRDSGGTVRMLFLEHKVYLGMGYQ